MRADEMTWVLDDDVVHVLGDGDGDEREPARWGLPLAEWIANAQGGSRERVSRRTTYDSR